MPNTALLRPDLRRRVFHRVLAMTVSAFRSYVVRITNRIIGLPSKEKRPEPLAQGEQKSVVPPEFRACAALNPL
jgi:hypothetical protein